MKGLVPSFLHSQDHPMQLAAGEGNDVGDRDEQGDYRARRVSRSMGACGRFAAIVDLENVATMGDGLVSQAEMQVLLSAIGARVSGMPVRVATGVNVLRPYMDLIGLQRWGLTLVKTGPDAADDALCEAAQTSSAARSPTSLSSAATACSSR